MNVDKKSLEIEFSIAICRPPGDKRQWKTLFLSIFDPCPSIFKSVFDCRLPGVIVVAEVLCQIDMLKKKMLLISSEWKMQALIKPYNIRNPDQSRMKNTNVTDIYKSREFRKQLLLWKAVIFRLCPEL